MTIVGYIVNAIGSPSPSFWATWWGEVCCEYKLRDMNVYWSEEETFILSDLGASGLVSHYTPMCPKSTAITQLLEGLQCHLMGGDKHNVLELMGPISGAGSTFKGLAFAEVVP